VWIETSETHIIINNMLCHAIICLVKKKMHCCALFFFFWIVFGDFAERSSTQLNGTASSRRREKSPHMALIEQNHKPNLIRP